uniref:7TM_GPCR_Srx domain-containing protein n=1 Tax=Steinernema glaseri TaxID=37863 RepID=A0A1I7YCA2_9BILA
MAIGLYLETSVAEEGSPIFNGTRQRNRLSFPLNTFVCSCLWIASCWVFAIVTVVFGHCVSLYFSVLASLKAIDGLLLMITFSSLS